MNRMSWEQAEIVWSDLGFAPDVFEEAKITTLGDAMAKLAPYVEGLMTKVTDLATENEVLRRQVQIYRDTAPPTATDD